MNKLEIIKLTAAEYNNSKIEEILDKVSKQTVLYAIHAGYAGVVTIPVKYKKLVKHLPELDSTLVSAPTVLFEGAVKVPPTSYNITVYNIYKELVLEIRLKQIK
jgi:hypothetical protein